MDNKVEILLGSQKNINSVNTDSYGKIELANNVSELTEFTVNDIVNSTEVFDAEREANQVYRIYGRIEYMSLLNGVAMGHNSLEDFFNPIYTGNSKNIFNSFDFYLVAPHTGDTYSNILNTNKYVRSFQVIAGMDDFEIYPAGFTNNVYGEQVYAFSFKSDFDVSNYYDKLGFPLTELFLYVQYKPSSTIVEQMSYTTWSLSTGAPSKVTLNKKDLNIGDDVETNNNLNIMDVIEYIPEEYLQTQVEPQKFFIRTRYFDSGNKWLEWSYNPFIPFRLRYLDDVVSTAKLSEIIKNSTTLDVYIVTSPSTKLNATKSLAQSLSTTINSVKNWDAGSSSSAYNWYPTTGEVEFTIPAAFTYDITFKTQIYLPNDSDKYIGEIYLEDLVGTGWEEIPDTRRKFLITNSTQSVHFTKQYLYGNRIRIRTRLIPNPDARKIEIIPDYALMLTSQGKYVWRDILPQGYIDPLTGVGVDYPFFNKRRYLFAPLIFDIVPNLSEETWEIHQPTLDVFNEISYSKNATNIDMTPLTELDNIGKPCQ